MNKIPKCKTKTIVMPQQTHYLKVNKKCIINDRGIPPKITQKKIKFNSNIRQFGKDITITLRNSKKEENDNLKTKNTINANNVNNVNNNIFISFFYIDSNIYQKTFSIISSKPIWKNEN